MREGKMMTLNQTRELISTLKQIRDVLAMTGANAARYMDVHGASVVYSEDKFEDYVIGDWS